VPHGAPMASRTGSLGRGCENDFGREERTPFAGGRMFGRRAAGEFVTVIGFSDEAGGDEGGDDVAAYAINKVET